MSFKLTIKLQNITTVASLIQIVEYDDILMNKMFIVKSSYNSSTTTPKRYSVSVNPWDVNMAKLSNT